MKAHETPQPCSSRRLPVRNQTKAGKEAQISPFPKIENAKNPRPAVSIRGYSFFAYSAYSAVQIPYQLSSVTSVSSCKTRRYSAHPWSPIPNRKSQIINHKSHEL